MRLGALMEDLNDDPPLPARPSDDRGAAFALAIVIVLCLAAFVLIFVGLEPFMSDFTGGGVIATPDPSVVPADETVTNDAVQTP